MWSTLVTEAIQAMDACEPLRAVNAFQRLGASVQREQDPNPLIRNGIWESFLKCLDRRGYFVSTSEEIAASLNEIRDVGAGFDLYEMARAMAQFDGTLTDGLGRVHQRLFPELRPFSPKGD